MAGVTDSKGSAGEDRAMHTLDPRAVARNRANRRLRRMTIGTAALGVASVGILSATAAFTYDGSQPAGAVALAATGGAATTSGDTAAGNTTPSTRSSSSSSGTATPWIIRILGTAHASTGGS
jgi:hypothetical protein